MAPECYLIPLIHVIQNLFMLANVPVIEVNDSNTEPHDPSAGLGIGPDI
jgi:hypothetical protein